MEYFKNIDEKYQLKEIKIEDYDKLDAYYKLRRPQTSDSSMISLFLWKECYPTRYYMTSKGIIWVAQSEDGQYYSVIPSCKEEDLKECFKETEKFFNNVLKKKLTMYVVDKAAIEKLELPEDKYVIVRDRSYDDYIYDAEKLRTLSGKKYHKKKNHLNAFKREYAGRYEFKLLDCGHKDELIQFLDRWRELKKDVAQHEYIDYEAQGIQFLLDNCYILDFKVGGVYIDGVLEAFTIGNYYEEEDMVYIPVEKANSEIRGLYAYINSQFLIEAFPNASKVNREDDMGMEGLRHAKQSYNPIYMIEKYTIMQK